MSTNADRVAPHLQEIKEELANCIQETYTDAWARSLYRKAVSKNLVQRVKAKLRLDDDRLVDIPRVPSTKAELRGALVNVLATIMRVSGVRGKNRSREVVDTHDTNFEHWEVKDYYSSPDISIRAVGNSFEIPRSTGSRGVDCSTGFSNVTSIFTVKLDTETNDWDARVAEAEVYEMGVHAREIFLQQPNRKIVRLLILTEMHVRLIQYDRAGAIYTPLICYHDDPDTFIRFVVGLSSHREEDIGLDTSFRWTTINGRKSLPAWVDLYDPKTKGLKSYQLLSPMPFFSRSDLCDRGTKMWRVVNPESDNGTLLVKDAWVKDGRTPEFAHLSKAVGIKGVQQLIDFEDYTGRKNGEVQSFRPYREPGRGAFFNKILQRIVTPLYGPSISLYKTEKVLLDALCDAISAHERLLDRGILHSDISAGNILLPAIESNAPEGLRGMLIDLDYAIRVQFDIFPMSNRIAGTRKTQSYIQLRGRRKEFKPAQDYLDDLESFFYVLAHIIFQKHDSGMRKNGLKKWIRDCGSPDDRISALAKKAFLSIELVPAQFPSFWSAECVDLVISFHKFIAGIVRSKETIVGKMDKPWDVKALRNLHEEKDEHYRCVLGLFEKVLSPLPTANAGLGRCFFGPTEVKEAPRPNPTLQPSRCFFSPSEVEADSERREVLASTTRHNI
ncbi:hypothetical protein DFP72DRAFT_954037 [Ephemerocybe angulata]|uniref:Fungal-type protein kinase domain-containing protein n=1 Tax=Ephemerocybe angulata TaxID=980116 RepID=A0A8H6MDP9_9AGAR|nr:hypothetical protein DFP72DRAFT_954037 [Tulosesus angulatus]